MSADQIDTAALQVDLHDFSAGTCDLGILSRGGGSKEEFMASCRWLWSVGSRWKGRNQHGPTAHIGCADLDRLTAINGVGPECDIAGHAASAW